jgi:hypothetical protein
MVVKNPDVTVASGKSCKFGLKFPPVPLPTKKEFILAVIRNGTPWERIKIIATYS